MKDRDGFVKAYHDFRRSVDLTKNGILPELDNLVWCILMGVPQVPADEDGSEDAQMVAVDQRVTILKAVFVEVNRDQPEDFIDQGLSIYDQAARKAKNMLHEADSVSDAE